MFISGHGLSLDLDRNNQLGKIIYYFTFLFINIVYVRVQQANSEKNSSKIPL